MADKMKIKLVRSPIGTSVRVRDTLAGLGLRRVGRVRELERNAMVEGMMHRVAHLVVEVEVKD